MADNLELSGPWLNEKAAEELRSDMIEEVRTLIWEYDPSNSDWGFRKQVIYGLLTSIKNIRR